MKLRPRALGMYTIAALFILGSCKMYYKVADNNTYKPTPGASVERGKMLVESSCAGCHFDPATGKLSGRQLTSSPKIAGKVFTANLTQSTSHSPMPKYTEAEFAYLMRTGVARDGRYVPYMLRPHMSDRDISAMFAYLRSSDKHVQPHNAVTGVTKLNFIGKLGSILVPKPMPFRASVPEPDRNDDVAYGRYLVYNIGCWECHSKKGPLSLDFERPYRTNGYMAGGRKFKMPDGVIRSSNITMHKETGIGNYTAADFRNAVLKGKGKTGDKLKPPMKAFHLLSEKEADAIFAYIQSLAPVKHKIK